PGSMWTVSAEALELGVNVEGTGALTLADGGILRIGASGSGVVHAGYNERTTGVVTIGAETGQAAVGAGVLQAGEVRFQPRSSGTLNFNHTDADYVFAPRITGYGTVNHYAGTT